MKPPACASTVTPNARTDEGQGELPVNGQTEQKWHEGIALLAPLMLSNLVRVSFNVNPLECRAEGCVWHCCSGEILCGGCDQGALDRPNRRAKSRLCNLQSQKNFLKVRYGDMLQTTWNLTPTPALARI